MFRGVRPLRLSDDARSGRDVLRGLGFWQLDLSAGKATRIAGGVRLTVSVDAINVLNHVNFGDPSTGFGTTNLQAATNFGVITNQRISALSNIFPRRIQFGVRLDF